MTGFKWEFDLDKTTSVQFNLISANSVSIRPAASLALSLGTLLVISLVGNGACWSRHLFFCLGALLQVVASSSTGLGIMYAGRVIVGLSVGATSNLAPIYVAEISPPAIHGRLIGLYELCLQVGGVASGSTMEPTEISGQALTSG
ncbi:putative quinate permease [Hypsizygus marmoreus]|uniref:Quinate permease n=1 Tax=Hypsizygus marmoreus TaxID=39966 RepID=A0A369K276_HYPMA|nr:putative quinate permease [Hypsizygus marmoreus]